MAVRKSGGNFFNLLQKERGTKKGGGVPQKREVPNLEVTMAKDNNFDI